jgi:hypothetical protein
MTPLGQLLANTIVGLTGAATPSRNEASYTQDENGNYQLQPGMVPYKDPNLWMKIANPTLANNIISTNDYVRNMGGLATDQERAALGAKADSISNIPSMLRPNMTPLATASMLNNFGSMGNMNQNVVDTGVADTGTLPGVGRLLGYTNNIFANLGYKNALGQNQRIDRINQTLNNQAISEGNTSDVDVTPQSLDQARTARILEHANAITRQTLGGNQMDLANQEIDRALNRLNKVEDTKDINASTAYHNAEVEYAIAKTVSEAIPSITNIKRLEIAKQRLIASHMQGQGDMRDIQFHPDGSYTVGAPNNLFISPFNQKMDAAAQIGQPGTGPITYKADGTPSISTRLNVGSAIGNNKVQTKENSKQLPTSKEPTRPLLTAPKGEMTQQEKENMLNNLGGARIVDTGEEDALSQLLPTLAEQYKNYLQSNRQRGFDLPWLKAAGDMIFHPSTQ